MICLLVKQFKIYYSCFKEVQRATRGTIQQKQGNIVNKIRNLMEEIIKNNQTNYRAENTMYEMKKYNTEHQ